MATSIPAFPAFVTEVDATTSDFITKLMNLPLAEIVEIHNHLCSFAIVNADGTKELYRPQNETLAYRWRDEVQTKLNIRTGNQRASDLVALHSYIRGYISSEASLCSHVEKDYRKEGYADMDFYYCKEVEGHRYIANISEYGVGVTAYISFVLPYRIVTEEPVRNEIKRMLTFASKRYKVYSELAKHPFVTG